MIASVVVPTYNRPDRLRKLMESISKQNSSNFEVIVVDDGSTIDEQKDLLEQIKKEDNRHVIHQQNGGPASARNRGWNSSDSDYILFTDDDCILPQNWVSSIVDAFEQGVAAVGGPFIPAEWHFERSAFAQYHRYQSEDMYRPIEQSRIQTNPLPHGITANIGYRRSVLEEVGGFDESFPVAGGEDADLIQRVSERGYSFKYVPVPVHHNDLYNLETFLNRSYNRGKGLHHLHSQHGPRRGIPRVLLGLLASPLFVPVEITCQRGLNMAAISVLDRIVNRLGELSAAISDWPNSFTS